MIHVPAGETFAESSFTRPFTRWWRHPIHIHTSHISNGLIISGLFSTGKRAVTVLGRSMVVPSILWISLWGDIIFSCFCMRGISSLRSSSSDRLVYSIRAIRLLPAFFYLLSELFIFFRSSIFYSILTIRFLPIFYFLFYLNLFIFFRSSIFSSLTSSTRFSSFDLHLSSTLTHGSFWSA